LLSDSWHPYSICPQCGSSVRHRLLIGAVNHDERLGLENLVSGRRVLHFAAEPIIADIISTRAAQYVQADLFREHVDMRLDLCDMEELENGSFDLLVACDVLEHVPDDGLAMDEISRVLSPGGWAILTVPQKDHLKTTYEDSSITTEQGRLEAFGQEDHLRIYGDDFENILASHDFSVISVDEHHFEPDLARKHVLYPPVLSPHPLATNFRKVFFAQKPLVKER